MKISKFEKIFWVTILFLLIIYLSVKFMALSSNEFSFINKPVLDPVFIGLNLDKYDANLTQSLKNELENLNVAIDKNIDSAFMEIEKNIDHFLDFHYSVKGEYIELGALAAGNVTSVVKKELIGFWFEEKLKSNIKIIDSKYLKSIKKHTDLIHKNATDGIDFELNTDLLKGLQSSNDNFLLTQESKMGLLLMAKFTPKIIQAIASKVLLKASSKLAIKGTTKIGAKYASAGTAAIGGTVCGPLVWVCSPALATAAWFATDAVVVSIDEYYNREKLKKDIQNTIDEQKNTIKNKIKEKYKKSFQKLSKHTRSHYRNTSIKKIKIKEMF